MINPKELYRKLDALLADIYQAKSVDILPTVLKEFLDLLSSDLHIVDGRLYEETNGKFDLMLKTGSRKYTTYLDKKDKAVQLILQHGCYIFNEPTDLIDSALFHSNPTVPAAFVASSEEKRWIFIFELEFGWEREEIELCLNTVRMLINSRLSSEQIQNYIQQAEMIQKSLLPERLPAIKGFEIAARLIPTEVVGGDLYDFFIFDSEHFAVAVGDASGHGLPAALLVRDVVTGLRMGLEKHLKMTYALEKLNRVIHRSRLSTSFISLFYAEIESNGNVIYVNAGHPSPLLIKKDYIEEFPIGGLILGPLPEVKLKRGFKFIDPGDVIILYSDGLIERKNNLGEPFDLDRVKNIVQQNIKLSANDLLEKIISAAHEFGGDTKWEDDVTVVVIKKL